MLGELRIAKDLFGKLEPILVLFLFVAFLKYQGSTSRWSGKSMLGCVLLLTKIRLNKAFSLGGSGFDDGILSSCHFGRKPRSSQRQRSWRQRKKISSNFSGVFKANQCFSQFSWHPNANFFFHPSCCYRVPGSKALYYSQCLLKSATNFAFSTKKVGL